MSENKLSVYLSYLLRHRPDEIGLSMDEHGWVDVQELIDKINAGGEYTLDTDRLEGIVTSDKKGRYRFNEDGTRIKACQGHSIEWVIPELDWREPPQFLYHGTTAEAYEMILASGGISRMSRHAVHMQAEAKKAWQSAKRWKKTPVVLEIDARRMFEDDIAFGVTENEVWCCEAVPKEYIANVLTEE